MSGPSLFSFGWLKMLIRPVNLISKQGEIFLSFVASWSAELKKTSKIDRLNLIQA